LKGFFLILSKTDFLMFLDAPMHLWAKTHGKLEQKPLTPYEQHLLKQGQQVESLASEYIETVLLHQYSHARVLWQPAYDDGRFEIRADALIFDQDAGLYDLYEIKSSTSIHPEHKLDLTFQVLLLESILELRHVYLLHIDKTYRHGDVLDLERFFLIEELSQEVEKHRQDVDRWRHEALEVIEMEKPLPAFACTKPKTCPCPSLCHPGLSDHPVYDIPYIGRKAGQLREMGVTDIKDIPATFNLNSKQKKHYQSVKSGQALIDREAIRSALAGLTFPLHFLDYETFNPAVPLFHGYRPYEHIAFQYSLFVLQAPGADPQHYDCLLTDGSDPAPVFVPHLLGHIQDQGSVIVWNQSFEAHRNLDLTEHCPQYADQLMNINGRLFDLMLVFKEGLYVHQDFHGSASLKNVLPVLCPNLHYDDLMISNGEEAMLTWIQIIEGKYPPEQQREIETALLKYCEMDTYGMVAIWEKLRNL
jgi:hypothetical protein